MVRLAIMKYAWSVNLTFDFTRVAMPACKDANVPSPVVHSWRTSKTDSVTCNIVSSRPACFYYFTNVLN